VFEPLWRVEPDKEVCRRAPGGAVWELLKDSRLVTKAVISADSSRS
jgi:hypothetical protein